MKIGALTGILRRTGGADPVDGLAARRRRAHHGFGLVPLAQPGDPQPAWTIRVSTGDFGVLIQSFGGVTRCLAGSIGITAARL